MLEYSKIIGKVDDYLIEELRLNNSSFEVEIVENLELSHKRFDIPIKLNYLQNTESQFSQDLYDEHIKIFTGGQFTELGQEQKQNINDYRNSFRNLNRTIKESGFDEELSLIPLASCGSVLNGAHRFSSCKLNKQKFYALKTTLESPNYDYNFFKSRGMSVELLDSAATKFAEYSNNTYLACVWPAAVGKDKEIQRILGRVVYKKEINLNANGSKHIVSTAYRGESWLGDRNSGYSGSIGKTQYCFPNSKPLRVYLFQCDSLDNVLKIKDKIRDLYGIGKHSIHITDNKEETLRLSDVLFNQNSIHFANYGRPFGKYNCLSMLNKIDKKFNKENIISRKDRQNIAITSSMTLSVYGLRSASDIDYFSNVYKFEDSDFDNASSQLEYYESDASELLGDPKNYFIFEEIKFISLNVIRNAKKSRAERKDEIDIKLIGSLKSDSYSLSINKFWFKLVIYNYRLKKYLADKAIRLGCYEFLRKFNIFRSRL
ncbi:hypothetical protein BCT06_13680 [Vibrio breoganii]|uniref:hypothetical protein n=1 Tax=Vibrio breoganii TaxID=553239 RepID=UPI000C84BAD1|nr:hypothetical protein [Vibrio breoganii]PMO59956.1 hypothetical protein BCT06_13680 [Vibrio breoganii]